MSKFGTTLTAVVVCCCLSSVAGVTSVSAQGPSPAVSSAGQSIRPPAPSSARLSDTARSTLVASLPTLREGATGGSVLALQIGLRAKGARYLQGTGYFGPLTERAVRGFQRDRGLAVDGVVGPRTWDALVVGTDAGAPYALANPQLSPGQAWPTDGSGNSRYGYLQLGLTRLHGLVEWAPAQTPNRAVYEGSQVAAVTELQRRAGLNPSGIFGVRTTRVLLMINVVVGGFGN